MSRRNRILSFLLVTATIWACDSYCQETIIHHISLDQLTCDRLGHVWVQDANDDIYRIESRNLVREHWSERHLRFRKNDHQKAIFSSGPFLYEAVNKELITLATDKSTILHASACANGGIAFINEFQHSVLLDGQIEVCPFNGGRDTIIDIESFKNKYLALSGSGLVELCQQPEIIFTNDVRFTSMCLLDPFSVLLGSQQSGLWIFKNDRFRQCYIPGIEFPDHIKTISKSGSNLFILDGSNTLFHYDWDKQSMHVVDEQVNDYVTDAWNTLWYVSDERIIKNIDYVNEQLPIISFDRIESNYKKIDHTASLPYKTAKNGLALFTQSYYSPRNDDLVYYFSLDGGNTWQSNGESGLILIDRLKPGRHAIRVKSTVNDVHFSIPLEIDLKVKSNFFKTTWFYVLIVISLFILVALVALLLNNQRKQQWEKERQKIQLELELARKQQQLGQLQLNPHFLFNSLNSISGLIALKDNTNARKYLNQFSQMMRSLLDQSLDDSILLSQEMQFIEQYLALEKMINNDKFDYEIKCTIDSDPAMPIMLIQPFIENAILHGIKPKKGKGIIKISFEEKVRHIIANITDDGVGRQYSEANHISGHRSSALKIIEQRLNKLDKWHTDDNIIFNDLKDADNNPAGTSVTILIPKN